MGRTKSDAIKERGANKKAPKRKGVHAQAQKMAKRAKAKETKKWRDSDTEDELEKGGSGSDSVAATTESSSDDGVVEEEIVGMTKKLKRAEDTIKHLDASIAAQGATVTNEKRLAELAQTRNNFQSEVEVTELYFRTSGSEIQFQYSLRTIN
jgi:hypothetical protein